VEICPWSCLQLVPLAGLRFADGGETLDGTDLAAGLGEEATAMVKDETACIRCGLCEARCPTRAITMELCTLEEVA